MIIYLAGGMSGNLSAVFKEAMKLFLAGTYSREYCIQEAMKLFLAGNGKGSYVSDTMEQYKPFILESFHYLMTNEKYFMANKDFFGDFLLDSGAFTYMNTKSGEGVDWVDYIKRYAAFINKYDIDKFLELDIDNVVGYDEVKRLRALLETLTNKKCIPVWHKSRGIDEYKKMCQEYSYAAIGGIVTKEIKPAQYPVFKNLLKIAAGYKCRIHGLGFTGLAGGLEQYKFHSVDSTAWLYGNRGGFLYKFNGRTLEKIIIKNKRLKSREAAIHNFIEWCKFQQYAYKNL